MIKQFRHLDLGIAAALVLLSLISMVFCAQSPVSQLLIKEQRITGILLGSDYDDNARHSDTMMVWSYDPQSRFVDIMSVPRDTIVSLPGLPGIHRINEVFTYEFRKSHRSFSAASEAVKQVVENIISSGTTSGSFPIPYYVTIDYKGFKSLISAIGGVTIKVSEPMHYDDNWGHLHIHFEPGTYQMNGVQALNYVRYRGGGAGDHGRILRQQLFLKQFIDALKNPLVWWTLPRQAAIILKGVHSNLSFWDMMLLAYEASRMKRNDMRLMHLPGTTAGNRWKVDTENIQKIVSLMQQPAVSLKPAESASSASDVHRAPTVEIWNASGYPNIARAMLYLLRREGFDVVKFGDFERRQERTLIVDRSGRLRPAQAVAEVLKIANPEVVSRVEKSGHVDVWVIIGNDYPVQKDKRLKL